ncbi:MAG TPA: sugar phosphate isomerase/epimerase family protein [Lacipirellulaceae bacterium]|nr:sugar phosphate isomerase/epimerase family protein [Lacipirellulaceae bacterium]
MSNNVHNNTRRNLGRIFKTCKWGMIQGGTKTILQKFKLCKEAGFDGIELINPLNFGQPGSEKEPEKNDPKISEILAASRETEMPIHGLVNILGNRKAHIASPDEATREKGRALLEQSVRNCHAYGGSAVLLVPGKVGGPDETHDEVWKRSIEQVRKVLPVASELGVRICIETVWNKFCEKPEQLRDYVDEIDNPWFGVWLDLGNVRKLGPTENWVRTLGTRIVKLDVKGYTKKHGLKTKIGDGEINWPAVCDALAEINYCGWAAAEVRGGGREWLADIVERMNRVLEIK